MMKSCAKEKTKNTCIPVATSAKRATTASFTGYCASNIYMKKNDRLKVSCYTDFVFIIKIIRWSFKLSSLWQVAT